MYPSSSGGLNKETESAVYFFTTPFHPLDNFSAHTIALWGKVFPTAEHAFQWRKFSTARPDIAEKIFTAKSPHAVKEISNAHRNDRPTDWLDQRVQVMEEVLRKKADQHEDVREALQRTGSRQIVENSPVDDFWGTGPKKDGQNVVGKLWMKIRDTIA